jgi:hypothetical protein
MKSVDHNFWPWCSNGMILLQFFDGDTMANITMKIASYVVTLFQGTFKIVAN